MKSTGTIIFVKENVYCSQLKLQVSRVLSSRKLNILAYVLFLSAADFVNRVEVR
jgi:hypothetical protein